MLHSCGQTHFQLALDSSGFTTDYTDDIDIENYVSSSLNNVKRQLYTAYLGQVTTEVSCIGDIVYLEKYHSLNNQHLLVKVLDAREHNLYVNRMYGLNKLKTLSAKKINLKDNEYYYVMTLFCVKKLAQIMKNDVQVVKTQEKLEPFLKKLEIMNKASIEYPELLSENPVRTLTEYKKVYQKIIKYNSPVDIFFNTCNYLDFLYQTAGLVSVNNLDAIISVSGLPDLDNAFFTGQYMVYGDGDKMFYPLTSLDVVGHELSHGLVSGTANLEYKGHSGALNESFADIMGTMFEFYMYEKYPHLHGKKDWLIGEDLGMGRPFLRSMEDPNKGNQPCRYQGKYYLNPNSPIDFGGVHVNSGIANYCFYLASQESDKNDVLATFIKCLKQLEPNSNFIQFRDTLKNVSQNNPYILSALKKVGLNDNAVSDYNPNSINP